MKSLNNLRGSKLLDVGTFYRMLSLDVKHILLGIGDVITRIAGIHTSQYDEETKRFQTQLRLQEEARREAIKLGGPGARGIGQTMCIT